MIDIVLSLAPVFALIVLGWAMRQFAVREEKFWEPIENLTYFVLFPALLIHSMAQAPYGAGDATSTVVVLVAVMLLVAAGLILARQWLVSAGDRFAASFQGAIRFNTYVGLAAAMALFGRPGVTMLAIVLAVMIPLSNVLSVWALASFAGGKSSSAVSLVREFALNPLIIASLIGLTCNLSATRLPPVLGPMLDILGKGALPLGLLAVGAGLNFSGLIGDGRGLVLSTLLKLFVSPLLAWAGCKALGVNPLATGVAVLFAALPPAPSAFILTRRMGGDHQIMAAIITIQTLLAAITLPTMLTLLL